jgi:hypothetical protein
MSYPRSCCLHSMIGYRGRALFRNILTVVCQSLEPHTPSPTNVPSSVAFLSVVAPSHQVPSRAVRAEHLPLLLCWGPCAMCRRTMTTKCAITPSGQSCCESRTSALLLCWGPCAMCRRTMTMKCPSTPSAQSCCESRTSAAGSLLGPVCYVQTHHDHEVPQHTKCPVVL